MVRQGPPGRGHSRVEPRQHRGVQVPQIEPAETLDAIPDGIVIVDRSGRITYMNALLEEMSGYRSGELVGRNVEELLPEAMRSAHIQHRERFMAEPHTRPMGANLDIRMRRKDGSTFPADIALSPLKGSGGPFVLAAIRDASERRRLAVVEDRERIARELHDGVIQALFAVGMNLQATEAKADDPQAVRVRLNAAVESIDAAIHDLRSYIFGLRPGILADRQLEQALEALGEETEGRSGIAVVVEVDPRVAASLANQASQLVQVAREALSNVVRHAGAQTCRVSLRAEGGHAILEIDDDGTGFDTTRASSGKGQGLRNMRERVEALRGRLSVTASRTDGTNVRIAIPL